MSEQDYTKAVAVFDECVAEQECLDSRIIVLNGGLPWFHIEAECEFVTRRPVDVIGACGTVDVDGVTKYCRVTRVQPSDGDGPGRVKVAVFWHGPGDRVVPT